MTPQEAATMLREWYIAFNRHGKGNERAVKEFLEIADFLESTAADLDTLREFTKELAARNEELNKEKLAAVLRVPRWISVEERLPDKSHDWVLVIGKWESDGGWIVPHVAECRDGIWVTNGTGWRKIEDLHIKITHWMPLPEPPEEDET